MEKENKQMNKTLKRIIIGISLVCVSLTVGVVTGTQLTNGKITIVDEDSPTDQLISFLKDNWFSDVFYGNQNTEDIIINQFVGALSTSDKLMLDPYTYLIKNESGGVQLQTGKLGITTTFHYNYPVIKEVAKGSAADGILKVGDIITTTGRRNGKGWDYYSILDNGYDYSNLISSAIGLPGDDIYIEVARIDKDNKLTFHSNVITLKAPAKYTSYSYLVDEDIDDTIMVKMTSFVDGTNNNNTCDQFADILKNNPSKNLILDLRDNGGGDIASTLGICDLFLEKDVLVATIQYKDGTVVEKKTLDNDKYEFDNICILQNENTASASEILISALQYYFPDKVTLIGSKTYGKGIGQRKQSVLDNKYTLQYICAKWLRPDGSWIGMKDSFYSEGYQLGFEPSENCKIERNNLHYLMEYSNQYIYYKKNLNSYSGFKYDNVSSVNIYFYAVYNQMFNDYVRTDGYFDDSCINGIKNYQVSKGLYASGQMNENTFLHFVHDFVAQRQAFDQAYVDKAQQIIEG